MSNTSDIIIAWLKNNPLVFTCRFDENILTLAENFSQKKISLNLGKIIGHRIKQHPQGLPDYLNLVFDNGQEIVLTHAGLAFTPLFQNTGYIQDAPEVVCMSDYNKLWQNLQHLLQDSQRKNEAILLFQLMISVLDGARAVGLDISQEEKLLDELFTKFEQNTR